MALINTAIPEQTDRDDPAGTRTGPRATSVISFFGATPVIQPIGDGGAPGTYTYTLAALTTALKNLGLIAT